MLVLGIDPGSTVTGYGLVRRERGRYRLVHAGAVKTRSKDPIPQRLHEIHGELVAVIQAWSPDTVAIEAIFRHKSSESALRLGQARGVALLAAASAQRPIFEYNAMTVKKSVTGSGRADKKQIRRVVGMLTGADFSGLPDDAADAVAIAITHLAHAPHHAAVERLR
ncbi:MAG: crossover junction endodeoxyribonuclease RuvC [Myxococcota bacterium]|nr:crossover junction endodeoxyribonuclease RuvC [Myxococcota bacterium]